MKRFEAAREHIHQAALEKVRGVDPDLTEQLLEALTEHRAVLVFGRGRSGLVGEALVIRLHHLGLNAFVVGDAVTPPVGDGDLVLCISGSGETFSVVVTARVARELGAKVVALTNVGDSSLARQADVVIEFPQVDKDPGLAPLGTLFEITAHLYFDSLVAALMARLDQDEADLRARHATLE